MSSFNSIRYAALLETLECSEVSFSHVIASAQTKRFDPEYFQKQHLLDEQRVASSPDQFRSFSELNLHVNASAFYPAIEGYYNQGDLPFLRVADVDAFIDFEQAVFIPAELCARFPTLARVHPGDIVLTKGGSVARVGLLTKDAAVSRDLIFIDSSKLPEKDYIFLYLYFQTEFFNRMLIRSSSQTAQPHLTITLVRNLPILGGSDTLKRKCVSLVQRSYQRRKNASEHQRKAEQGLLSGLGLLGWKPPEPLTYKRRMSEVFTARRLDAEFFSPTYDTLFTAIRNHGALRLGDSISHPVRRGISPEYFEDGNLLVINSQHVGKTEISLVDNRYTRRDLVDQNARNGIVGKYDVLLNSTGRITIGRCQCLLEEIEAVVDNHVAIIRPNKGLDPIYLACFLNSMPGLMQTERSYTGSSGQIELRPDLVEDYLIWNAPRNLQVAIRNDLERAHAARRESRLLLGEAKKAVEIAIEQGETAALKFIDTKRE